jgi:hypothetical protein
MYKTISNYWFRTEGPKQVVVVFDGVKEPEGLESLSFLGESLVCKTVFPRRGPATGRNLAATHAMHETLIFCDSDVVVPEETFIVLGVSYENSIFLPAVLPFSARTKSARFFSDYALAPKLLGDQLLGVSACFSVRRDLFLRLGGFSELFTHAAGEDWEMFRRFQDSGVSVIFDNNEVVFHTNPTNPLDVARRAFRYARHGAEQLSSHSQPPRDALASSRNPQSIHVADVIRFSILLLRHLYLVSMTIGNDEFERRLISNASRASELASIAESRCTDSNRLKTGKLLTKIWDGLLRLLATINHLTQWGNVVATRNDLSRNDLKSYRGLVLLWRGALMFGFMTRAFSAQKKASAS